MSDDDIVRQIRENYDRDVLIEENVARDPLEQFHSWMKDAIAADLPDPNAMTLATINGAGAPSARIVLLRGFDARGFAFYTNYESRKGQDLAQNANAALVLFWATLHRQVRIEGTIAKLSAQESDAYFATRPRGHRLSAWASAQSAVIGDRAVLDQQMKAAQLRFEGKDVERPPHWGGYRLAPSSIEFWQGRPNRNHDRLRFTRKGDTWQLDRLAP